MPGSIRDLLLRVTEMALFVALAFVVGYGFFISDSEFWSMSVSREILNWHTHHLAVFYRPAFHLVLAIPFSFDLDNVGHIQMAKGIFCFVGAGFLWGFFSLYRTLYGSRTAWFLVLALLLSNLVWTQFFRVRADILASLFASLQLLWLVSERLRTRNSMLASFLVASLLGALAFLSTPKAVYQLMINTAFVYFIFRGEKLSRRIIFSTAPLGPALAVLAIAGAIQLGQSSGAEIYAKAMRYFVSGYFAHPTAHLEQTSWLYLKRNVIYDLAFWFIVFFSMVALFFSPQRSGRQSACLWAGVLSVVFALVHSQRLPFFLASLAPYCLLATGEFLNREGRSKPQWLVLFGALLLANMVFWFKPHRWYSSQKYQIAAVRFFEEVLRAHPGARLFDGQGILPRGPAVLALFSPYDDDGNRGALAALRESRAEFVAQTPRSGTVARGLTEILESDYRTRGQSFWVRKDLDVNSVPLPPRPFAAIFGFEEPMGWAEAMRAIENTTDTNKN